MLILSAKHRKEFGKRVRALRKKGILPAVLYGKKVKNLNLEIDSKEFAKVYQGAGESSLIFLEFKGKKDLPAGKADLPAGKAGKNLVLIHHVAFDPLSDKPVHVDFYQPSLHEEIEAKVALEFVGESLAVKDLGGTLIKNIHEVDVKALPQKLPHELKVDIEALKTFKDNILVKDIAVPDGVTVLRGPEEVIASVVAPKKAEEELEKPIEAKPEEVEKVGKEEKPEEIEEKKKEDGRKTK